MLDPLARDVKIGLTSQPKRLYSKYFYDARGDGLFQQIMALEEYYLTRAELEVFQTQKERLLQIIGGEETFQLVELGAGDGQKTKVLLEYFQQQNVDFSYCPVDISENVLQQLEKRMRAEIPDLTIKPLAGDYFDVLADLKFKNHSKTVAFFLGSNIGNFLADKVQQFLVSIHDNLRSGDYLMIGFDLKKDPKTILKAYNDSKGVTKAFNLNLLKRINNELGANFDLDKFQHNPVYDPQTGECRSYLVSTEEQEVTIAAIEKTVHFDAWEPIFMEVSKKYAPKEIEELAQATGFKVVENLYDSQKRFADSVWQVV
ncbi:dimethylhistidine N-methyltransferase [Marinoscillum furvescens DSM 4134]|uniref:Dimethylhistidine N-methyltransferase n=2 Tax=Marinoscillum furvescens TaxID=1026 RepID=A0A3D9LIC3_MARFU|nr:dimethylhistidine N-methyltransferase [Marinoscillum furvescens DSM 4134]